MEAVRLSPTDCSLLASRYSEHCNSHRRLSLALREAGADDAAVRLLRLRQIERRFDVDLGMLCYWFEQRKAPGTHPVQRAIITYIAHENAAVSEVFFRLDRIRELRELLEESRLVGEPES